MVRYLTLIELTDKGVHEIANSVKRAAVFCQEVESAGGKVTGQYWAIGHIDGAVVFEAPDDDTAAHLLLQLAHDGFVRTQSSRLFNAEEFQRIVPK
jgi:uncharacterized protein with GYD domain